MPQTVVVDKIDYMDIPSMSHPHTRSKGPVVEIALCLILGAVHLRDQQRRIIPEWTFRPPVTGLDGESSPDSNSIGTIFNTLIGGTATKAIFF